MSPAHLTSSAVFAQQNVYEVKNELEPRKSGSVKGQKPQNGRIGQKFDGNMDIDSIASLLQKCGNAKSITEGKHIHNYIIERGLNGDKFLGNHLIQMYGKCGALDDARQVFDNIPNRNSYSWNMMLGAYTQYGHMMEACQLFREMPQPDVVSWTSMLFGFIQQGGIDTALRYFEKMPQRNVFSWNALLAGYAQKGDLEKACKLFQQIPEKDTVSWNTMVVAYAQHGDLEKAIKFYENTPYPNAVTWNAMITAYARHGQLENAYKTFREMPYRDAVSWNAMLAAYTQHGDLERAQKLFNQMPAHDLVSWNTMMMAYSQEGDIDQVHKLFEQMPTRDVVSWNALIGVYSGYGHLEEVLELYKRMCNQGLKPDEVTFVKVIEACTKTGALTQGKLMHTSVIRSGCMSELVDNVIIHMYSKCGNLKDASITFQTMHKRGVISWNAVIAAYAQHGQQREALCIFKQMQLEGVLPNEVTYSSLLSACCHAGLMDEGCNFFFSMFYNYNVKPTMEHCNCISDLLGRVGWLEEAESLLNSLQQEPDANSWTALLGACRFVVDVLRAKRITKYLLQLEPECSAPYVLLSDIYALAGQLADAIQMRNMMRDYECY